MHRLIVLSFLLVLVFNSRAVRSAEPTKTDREYTVALFTGSGEENPFWMLFIDFMREAADDLGMKVDVYHANNSRDLMKQQVRTVCKSSDKPDAIVIHSFKRTGPDILRIANRRQVPVFLVNSGLLATEKDLIRERGEQLPHWIGQMLPDDYGAGYQLANALIDEAKKDPKRLGSDGKVHVIGLNGVVSHGASLERERGLRAAIDERDEATLDQVVAADWNKELAHKRCRVLLRRYPEASVIWSASDHMAVGAIEAMQDQGLTPGEDVVIGGVDATRKAMQLIDQGTMHATVGGHFMEGGRVAVLLHDFFRGVDPAQIRTQDRSPMTLVTKEQVAEYRAVLDEFRWERWDFRKLSRIHSPGMQSDSLDALALANFLDPNDEPFTKSAESDDSKADHGHDK